MSPADRPPSRSTTLRRVRQMRAVPAATRPESLTPFCGFATAMAELARRPLDQRIITGG